MVMMMNVSSTITAMIIGIMVVSSSSLSWTTAEMATKTAAGTVMVDALDVADSGASKHHRHNRKFKMGLLPQRLAFITRSSNVTDASSKGGDHHHFVSYSGVTTDENLATASAATAAAASAGPATAATASDNNEGNNRILNHVKKTLGSMITNSSKNDSNTMMMSTTAAAAATTTGHQEEKPQQEQKEAAASASVEGKSCSYLSRLYTKFEHSLEELGATNLTNEKLEKMSVLIHECMSNGSRNYHSIQHVFDLCVAMEDDDHVDHQNDPIGTLAALFHDCIYISVDGGLSTRQSEVLQGCLDLAACKRRVCYAHKSCEEDQLLCMVETIFGYEEDTEISGKNGINEFLSAMVAVRLLEPHLPETQLAQIALCIAATIPFRNKDNGESNPPYMEKLYNNMKVARERFGSTLLQSHADDDEFWIQTVQMATRLANSDVGNFGSEDRHYFLDNTWSLLSETNTPLRNEYLYTIMDYHEAVYKLDGFFNFLKDPEAIFASFRGVPTDDRLDYLRAQAQQNLSLGKKYVGAKLLSASVLAAFAELTGGDAPVSLFMGDLPSRQLGDSLRIDDFLPNPWDPEVTGTDGLQRLEQDEVFQILAVGRRSDTAFDVKSSPLAAYLYASVDGEYLENLLSQESVKRIMSYPMTEKKAMELLRSLPLETVKVIGGCVSELAVSRKAAIQSLLDTLAAE